MIPNNVVVADAENKATAYARIALDNADSPWLAVHAQAWADMYLAIAVSGDESVLEGIAAPDDSLLKTPAGTASAWRERIEATLSPEILSRWNARLMPCSYLPVTTDASPEVMLDAVVRQRIGHFDPEVRIASLLDKARSTCASARVSDEAGDVDAAIAAYYRADLLAFDAWLLQRSIAYGDTDLVQADLMWQLTKFLIANMGDLPADVRAAQQAIRSRLIWIAAPFERKGLFEHLTEITGVSTTF